ncbi:MAG: cbb3-type cytochrome c oxidase subunit I, partial [Bacteroidetes bacterium]|nr:cbb3-type cytochrome c oxidase subunit I [Bacteroidota bacterium]
GRTLNDMLGRIHFWGTLIFMNGIFFPMLIQGLAGVSRRLYDGGLTYDFAESVIHYNEFMSISAWLLALFQIPFIINFFWSIKKGKKVEKANHWDATTLEWSAAPTPPVAHGNFETLPSVYRGPYEYSPPDNDRAYIAQDEPPATETTPESVEEEA